MILNSSVVYSEPCQTSKMKLYAKTSKMKLYAKTSKIKLHAKKLLTVCAKTPS